MRHLFFLILTFILITPQLPSNAQSDSLTARETMRIGRGTIRHVEWHPDGDLILVDTVNGAWLYDDNLNDVAHLPDIRLARFSPNGQYISGVNAADELLIYDARTRDLLHAISQHDHHIHESHWQGNRLATYDGYQLVLWEDLEVTAVIDWRFLEMITWNPSGTMLVAKQLHGKLLIVTSEGDWWEIDAPGGNTWSLQWQYDTRILHTYVNDTIHPATLLDALTGDIIQTVQSGSNGQYRVRGGWLALIGIDGFYAFEIEIDNFRPYERVPGSGDFIAWSHNGDRIAYSVDFYPHSLPYGPLVYIVDLDGQTLAAMHEIGSTAINHIIWQPSDKHILTVDQEQRIQVWDTGSGQLKSSNITHALFLETYAISPSGDLIATANSVNGFGIWKDNELLFHKSPHTSPVELITWRPDGEWLVTSALTQTIGAGLRDTRVMIWDVPSGDEIEVIDLNIVPRDVEWRPDGAVLAIATYPDIAFWDGKLTVYTTEELGLGIYGPERAINWSPDSQYVSILSRPGTHSEEMLWAYARLNNSLAEVEIHSSHGNTESSMIWQNGKWMQLRWVAHPWWLLEQYRLIVPMVQTIYPTESEQNTLWFDPSPSEPLEELTHYKRMAWSPDAALVIGQTEINILSVWDVESGAYLYRTEGYEFAFSPDSQYLTILTDTHVNILDARTGEILLAIDEARFPQDDYTLQWSDDGTHLAIGGEGVVSVWEVGS